MRASIAIVLALCSTAAAAETKLTGNVLVWVDAPLYLDANEKAASIHLATLDQGREHDVGYVLPMRVLGEKDGFVEVEPTADHECAWWRLVRPEAIASLHLFVKREDLATALVKPFTAKFKDGSSITLQPGVAVLDGKVGFHSGVVPAIVPEASRGLSYAPHKIAPLPKRGKHTYLLDEKTDVTLDKQPFTMGPWVAHAADAKGKRMLLHIAARCMTAVISAPKEHVHADIVLSQAIAAADPVGHRAFTAATGDRYYLPSGTALTSATGDHVVATLAEDREIKKPAAGARACLDLVVAREEVVVEAPHTLDAAQPARTLHLCAPATAVKIEKR